MSEQKTSFTIFNSSESEIEIIHEPEAFNINIQINEEVTIQTNACLESVHLKVSIDNGKVIIGIWDDNSLYSVIHKGEDAFAKYL